MTAARITLVLICLISFVHVDATRGADKRAGRPNILFCIADDASYPHTGAYGCKWVKTPSFDRIAREGLLFNRAYTPNAKCAPSRSCILTGRNSWQLKAAANHWCFFPAEFKVFTEVLSEHGYFVGSTGKGWAPGVAKTKDGQPRRMTGQRFNQRRVKPPTRGIAATDYAANFKDFLDASNNDRPWCFWYGGFEPHRGYEFKSGISKGGKSIEQIDQVPPFWPDNETVRTDMLDYAFEIEHFDTHLGRMINMLDKRNMLDNTLIVVTADNGMPFPRVKGQEFEMSNHLPLAIRWPNGIRNPNRAIDDYVSFIDFAPTFIEVAGLDWEQTGLAPTTGRSLVDIFQSDKAGTVNPERNYVLIGKERHDVGRPNDVGYPIRGIVKEGYLFMINCVPNRWPGGNPETGYLNCDGSPTKTVILDYRRNGVDPTYWAQSFGKRPPEEMYYVSSDPFCMNNLCDDPDFLAKRVALREQLMAELKQQEDPRLLGNGKVFDQYQYANPADRNFYTRYTNGEKVRAGWVNQTDFEKQPIVDPKKDD